ncbi:MAG: signal peptidase II, partial [Jaaginema sp. PMC 1078.18]|nr:signal peptidase II [Jaaginema sp. PMC 1078.18]
ALLGLLLDQITKYWTIYHFESIGDTIPLIPGIFHLTYVRNTGAAFSLFAGGAGWLRWLSLAVSIALIGFAIWGPRLRPVEQLAYGFILAGAVGNGICRFIYGSVIDFLDFRGINFPVFNLADVCINIGIILLLIASFYVPSGNSRRRTDEK